jgi:hypothetical protein
MTGPPQTHLAPRFEQTGDRRGLLEGRMPLPSAPLCSVRNRASR